MRHGDPGFTVYVDGEIRKFTGRSNAIQLDGSDGAVEIFDDESGTRLAAIQLFEPEDVLNDPWTSDVEVPSGGHLTYTLGAEGNPPRLVLSVRHEAQASIAPSTSPEPKRQARPLWARRVAFAACILLMLGTTTVSIVRYDQLIHDLGWDEPFAVRFAAVDRRVLQVNVTVNRNVIREVFIDWGDSTNPDPAPDGIRIYPSPDAKRYRRTFVISARHEYPPVSGEGVSATARVRLVPFALPRTRPETLTEDKLHHTQAVLVTTDGIILDPPQARLRVAAPEPQAIVSTATELTVEMSAIRAPVHVFGADATNPLTYRYLGSIPPPAPGKKSREAHVVDTSGLGAKGSFKLVLVSTSLLAPVPAQEFPWQDIPRAAPRAEIELRHAGAILEPEPDAAVSGIDTVRAVASIRGQYASVIVHPVREGRFWVQNAPLPALEFAEFRVAARFGGRDQYEVWVALAADPTLLPEGAVLEQRPLADSAGRPVYWLGPVFVHLE